MGAEDHRIGNNFTRALGIDESVPGELGIILNIN
jgi:hypothetical protein